MDAFVAGRDQLREYFHHYGVVPYIPRLLLILFHNVGNTLLIAAPASYKNRLVAQLVLAALSVRLNCGGRTSLA